MAWLEWNPDGDDFPRWSEARNVIGTTIRWTEPQLLWDRRTSNVPSIAGNSTDTVMAWKGSGHDEHIWFSRLQRLPDAIPGGTQYAWGPYVPAGNGHRTFKTKNFPTMVQYSGRMFMFWKTTPDAAAGDGGTSMRWSELRGDTWVQPGEGNPPTPAWWLPDIRTEDGVAATEHQGKLYIAWREEGTKEIRLAHWDGARLSDPISFTDHRVTSKVPALVSDGRHLYMAWRSVDNNDIWWSTLEGPPQYLPVGWTTGSPALGRTNRGLVMVWVGSDDNFLWWSQFQNGQWSGQQRFTDRHMNLDLRVSLA
ncbi:hypothetical protein [Streptosporangium sp. LJ11]|uniref:hypothetical protein n=1 Tax=Streptosporangium sp. LJ11 TaxID=3436927 RepID=UPI003F798407